MKARYASIILAILITGCGSKSNSAAPAGIPESPGAQALQSINVMCEGDVCAQNVAAFYVIDNSGEIQWACTSFVGGQSAGKTIMLTNKHCFEGIEQKGLTCADNVFVKFPDSEWARCGQVLEQSKSSTSAENKINKDFAVFQLDRDLHKGGFVLANQPLQESTEVRAFYMDTDLSTKTSVLKQDGCRTAMNSVVNPSYDNAMSAVVTLQGCQQIKEGASGSPLILATSANEAVGIVQGGIAKEKIARLEKGFGIEVDSERAPALALATRMGCLQIKALNKPIDDELNCDESANAGKKPAHLQLDPADKAKLVADLNEWSLENSRILQFTSRSLQTPGALGGLTLEPYCVNASDAQGWLKDYKEPSLFSLHSYVQDAQVVLKVPSIVFKFDLDSALRSRMKMIRSDELVTYRFNPDQFSRTGSMTVNGIPLSLCPSSPRN